MKHALVSFTLLTATLGTPLWADELIVVPINGTEAEVQEKFGEPLSVIQTGNGFWWKYENFTILFTSERVVQGWVQKHVN